MRALRVVGLTEDGEVVLEDPVRLERYTVPADERLRAAARGDLSRLGQIAIELESQLRPREIQARIRAGASVEQVATAAGVPEQKIERFAYPVLTERFRTADNAQRAHPMRADGPDNRTLGEVVAHTFGLRGQPYEGVEVGLVEGRGRPLGGRAELAGRAVGQPRALGVPARRPRRHGHRARRARQRPGRGPARAPAAHRRCRGRHDPAGRGAATRALAGGAVAGGRVRQLPGAAAADGPRRRTADAERAVAARAVAASGRAADRSPPRAAGSLPAGRVPRGPTTGCLPPHRTPRRPAPGRSARGVPAGRTACRPASCPARLLPARGLPARSARPATARPTPAPRLRGRTPGARSGTEAAAGRPRSGRRGSAASPGPRRRPRPGGRPWRRDRAGSPDCDRTSRRRHVATPPLASPVIPAPTAEKDPVVEPATEPAAAVDVAEAPAETPAVAADAPTHAEAGGDRRGPGAGQGGYGTEPAAAETAPAEPTAAEPSASEPSEAAAPAEPSATEPSGAAAATDADAPEAPTTAPPAAEAVSPRPGRDQGADHRRPGARTRKGKPVMPSWDEVLLGVRGPR